MIPSLTSGRISARFHPNGNEPPEHGAAELGHSQRGSAVVENDPSASPEEKLAILLTGLPPQPHPFRRHWCFGPPVFHHREPPVPLRTHKPGPARSQRSPLSTASSRGPSRPSLGIHGRGIDGITNYHRLPLFHILYYYILQLFSSVDIWNLGSSDFHQSDGTRPILQDPLLPGDDVGSITLSKVRPMGMSCSDDVRDSRRFRGISSGGYERSPAILQMSCDCHCNCGIRRIHPDPERFGIGRNRHPANSSFDIATNSG